MEADDRRAPASPASSSRDRGPSKGIRLLIWLVVYFGLQLPLFRFRSAFAYFPMGLALLVPAIIPLFQPWMPYAVYGGHLALSLMTPSRRVFFLLLMILFMLVIANDVGCSRMAEAHAPD